MSSSKPQPLCRRPNPRRCPVCGASSYSASGVHPQCSARQLDADRLKRLKLAAVQLAAATVPQTAR